MMNTIKKGFLIALVFFIISVPFGYLIFRHVNWILSFEIASGLFLGALLMNIWQRNAAVIPGDKTFAGKGIVYEEIAPYSNSMKLIITLIFAVLAFSYFFAVFGHFFGFQNAPEQAQFALLLAVSIYTLTMWGFFSVKFRIMGSGVEAVMPPFKYSIPFSEIKEVKIIDNVPWYAGWGVRLWGRRLAFISMRKSAVSIEKKKGFFRKLILTTQNPEDFIKRLKEEIE
ncbi:MAG: hypothetical protein WCE94_03505 [Candidatus Methanoperedens sp.]